MRILYIADGRSPIALNWIGYYIRSGHEVHLASTFPCQPPPGLASMVVIPVALSEIYAQSEGRIGDHRRLIRRIVPVGLRTRVRQLTAPLSFPTAVNALQGLIERIQPEVIHAMRIPYEGMIASMAMKRVSGREGSLRKTALLISVWGNDFILHAKSTPIMSHYTRLALQNCDALHTDCQRDQRLAITWGFDANKPRIVLPGGGGVQMDIFYPPENERGADGIPPTTDKVSVNIINPRGFRAYVRNDTFFHAIPSVVNRFPDVHFVCPEMRGEEQAHRWVSEMGIGDKVDLLPPQTRQQMAELFRSAQISVSITTHDGTPNTLLEALACGCFPIAGDIESLREWIRHDENGLLVDPGDPTALAEAILNAISQPELRRQARERNLELVKERAEYRKCMQLADEFYTRLILNKKELY
jgi:glycosyltransferase involved in cell wall biosynthesis